MSSDQADRLRLSLTLDAIKQPRARVYSKRGNITPELEELQTGKGSHGKYHVACSRSTVGAALSNPNVTSKNGVHSRSQSIMDSRATGGAPRATPVIYDMLYPRRHHMSARCVYLHGVYGKAI